MLLMVYKSTHCDKCKSLSVYYKRVGLRFWELGESTRTPSEARRGCVCGKTVRIDDEYGSDYFLYCISATSTARRHVNNFYLI